jgi:nucleotide-binding universal stress UspA family protein
MQTILTPLDGTLFGERVLPYVRQLAPALGAQVVLLRGVTERQQEQFLERQRALPATAVIPLTPASCELCALTDQCQHTDCYLADQADLLRADGLEAYGDTRVGTPVAAIATNAARWPDSMVAMTTHAYSGLRRWVRGSLTDQIVHDTAMPLLLVRDAAEVVPPESMLKYILVPLDGTPFASQALPLAIELAARAHAGLTLLWVAAPSIDDYMREFPSEANLRRHLREQAVHAYSQVASNVSIDSLPLTTVIALGEPSMTIAHEAALRQIGLIVMATHGYTGLQRWRMGSVADELLRCTTAPLLLVRGQPNPN